MSTRPARGRPPKDGESQTQNLNFRVTPKFKAMFEQLCGNRSKVEVFKSIVEAAYRKQFPNA